MSPEVLKTVVISILFLAIFVVLPILYLLMDHQRKMVRLMRGEQVEETDTAMLLMGVSKPQALSGGESQALADRVRALESEVALLKATQVQADAELQQRTR